MKEKLNSLMPVFFGGFTGGYKGITIGVITLSGILDCIFYAALGAIVGYVVKLILDYIKNKHIKQKRVKKQIK